MKTIQGPAIFLAQFAGDQEPFNTIDNLGRWAVLEWECCLKSPEQGAAEGATFIQDHIIQTTTRTFDDFAGQAPDDALNQKILGIRP